MNALVVDANVWVAAADPTDVFHQESRSFLHALAQRGIRAVMPGFARLEVACALARRLGSPSQGRALAAALFDSPMVVEEADQRLFEVAMQMGTDKQLRAADALYAASAHSNDLTLVSWDAELISKAGAKTPLVWLTEE